MFDDFEAQFRFHAAWNAVEIVRPVHYSLFTFGQSDLKYILVGEPGAEGETVEIRRGEVKVTRPLVITADNVEPEFQNFFENAEEELAASFLLSRTASFSHLKFQNQLGPAKIVSDSVEEAVEKLNRQLDDEEEDRVAILTAPKSLSGLAVMKYAAERIWSSAPDNIQELRERGFLPE
jgi:hypothetical protein